MDSVQRQLDPDTWACKHISNTEEPLQAQSLQGLPGESKHRTRNCYPIRGETVTETLA